jgi:hypothetical protein
VIHASGLEKGEAMTRKPGFIALLAALIVLSMGRSATADPIRPTAFGEFVDFSPIDGAELQFFPGAESVALGPSGEARVVYEFSLAGLTLKQSGFATFSATRSQPFSECGSLSPCPELDRIDIFGYAGDGAITFTDYTAGRS